MIQHAPLPDCRIVALARTGIGWRACLEGQGCAYAPAPVFSVAPARSDARLACVDPMRLDA